MAWTSILVRGTPTFRSSYSSSCSTDSGRRSFSERSAAVVDSLLGSGFTFTWLSSAMCAGIPLVGGLAMATTWTCTCLKRVKLNIHRHVPFGGHAPKLVKAEVDSSTKSLSFCLSKVMMVSWINALCRLEMRSYCCFFNRKSSLCVY